ncbi:MAG: lysoplasmalogenase [Flavobacteriales bacterium]|nr:lysoplasmalogenase [Flavobacteriales bacterium]
MSLLKNHLFNGVLYALVSIGTIIGEVRGIHGLVYVCKPLMMIVLSSWFYFNSRRVGDRFTLLIQVGLFFSLIGDVALMFQHRDEFNFIIGLGAFLIAQLCYTLAFAHNVSEVPGGQGLLVSAVLGGSIIAYGAAFGSILLNVIDETLVVPVGIYAVAITLMGVGAALRFSRTYMPSFVMVFVGALLFIASDSILATSRFVRPVDHATWSVILTYAIAQYLIARGCLRHVLDPEEIRRRAALTT